MYFKVFDELFHSTVFLQELERDTGLCALAFVKNNTFTNFHFLKLFNSGPDF